MHKTEQKWRQYPFYSSTARTIKKCIKRKDSITHHQLYITSGMGWIQNTSETYCSCETSKKFCGVWKISAKFNVALSLQCLLYSYACSDFWLLIRSTSPAGTPPPLPPFQFTLDWHQVQWSHRGDVSQNYSNIFQCSQVFVGRRIELIVVHNVLPLYRLGNETSFDDSCRRQINCGSLGKQVLASLMK